MSSLLWLINTEELAHQHGSPKTRMCQAKSRDRYVTNKVRICARPTSAMGLKADAWGEAAKPVTPSFLTREIHRRNCLYSPAFPRADSAAGRGLLHHLVHPPLHLLRRHVFLVRGDVPDVAVRVLECAGAVAVELVLDRARELAAGGQCLLHRRVDVAHVEMQLNRGAAARVRSEEAHVRRLVREHHERIADLQLGVADRAVRSGNADRLFGAECPLVELDRLACALDAEIRRHGVIAGRYRLHLLRLARRSLAARLCLLSHCSLRWLRWRPASDAGPPATRRPCAPRYRSTPRPSSASRSASWNRPRRGASHARSSWCRRASARRE